MADSRSGTSKGGKAVGISSAFPMVNARAQAMERVGEAFPDDQIRVKTTPIVDRDSAMAAFEVAGIGLVRRNIVVTGEVEKSVRRSYEQMGQTGSHTLVEVEMPGGFDGIDLQGFYSQVDRLAPPATATA